MKGMLPTAFGTLLEFYAKIPPLLETGGYIPSIDHAVPPDVSYADFLYYLDLKLKLIGSSG